MSVQHDFYTARASEARADADKANLANVKERCLRAAEAWDAMAARAQRTDTHRATAAAAKAAGVEAH